MLADDDGFHAAAGPIVSSARKLGTEHRGTITRGVLSGAAATLGARIVSEGFKILRR